jgi:hypothetical protein
MNRKILVATYGLLMNSREMNRHQLGAYAVAKGTIENHDLEFKVQPTIIEKPNCHIPVVIWSIPKEKINRYEFIEFCNIGDFKKKELSVKIVTLTDRGIKEGFSRDEVTVSVYIYTSIRFMMQPSLADYNLLFSAYQEHAFDTAVLLQAALAAKTVSEERQRMDWEKQHELLKSTGLSGENPEIVYANLIAKSMLNINTVNSSSESGD